MKVIQGIVVVVALVLALSAVVGRNTHGARAGRKLALILLGLAMIVTVFMPDVTTTVANFLGVGRGADLLLYVTVLAFVLYVMNAYVRGQRDREVVTRLARQVAIIQAVQAYETRTGIALPTRRAPDEPVNRQPGDSAGPSAAHTEMPDPPTGAT